jgi:hypothetical protein
MGRADTPDTPDTPKGKRILSSLVVGRVGRVGRVMQFSIPGCREAPPLRANGTMVHLTYAALYPEEVNFEYILAAAREWASTRRGLLEYAIGKETHPRPRTRRRTSTFTSI